MKPNVGLAVHAGACALGAAVSLGCALHLLAYLREDQPYPSLVNTPPLWKPVVLLTVLGFATLGLATAAVRIRKPRTIQHGLASTWRTGSGLFWMVLAIYMCAIFYPIPPSSHHMDKILLIALLALAWSLAVLFRPQWFLLLGDSRTFEWVRVAVINLLVFALIAEGTLRLFDPLLARAGLFGADETPANLRPYVDVRGSIGRSNSQGFRDRERTVARGKTAPRVIALGDSFTWGAGVTYDETFVTLLEHMLQGAAPGAEVINLGVPGSEPEQEFHLVKAYGIRFQPEVVMLNVFIGNDIILRRGSFFEQVIAVAGQRYYVHSNGNWAHDTLGLDRWFLYHDLNYLLKVGMIRIGRLAGGRKDAYEDSSGRVRDGLFTRTQYLSDIADRSEIYLAGDGSVTESHWIRFERTLKELKQFLEKEGSRLLIVLIPDQIQVDHRLQADFFNASGRVAAQFEFERPQRLLRDWCETNRVSCVDLLPSFRASSDPAGLYIRNDLHWNVPGHALAAKEIFPSLLTEATSEAKSRRGAGHMKSASDEGGLCLRKSLTCG